MCVCRKSTSSVCSTGSGDLYDPATEVCDGGDIRSRLRNEYQCGLTKVYNEITDKCCMGNATHGVVHSKGNNYETYLKNRSEKRREMRKVA